MSLSHIDAKLAYVRQSLSAKEIDRLTATNTDEYLVLDLIYCITKHHNWLSVPVFQQLLCASLVNRHGLEFDA